MISTEVRKFILKLILVSLCLNFANGCNSNNQLYTEIGCRPVYSNGSDSCPVAYDCDNVFTRPADKCYFNGNVYEPAASLSKADSAINSCLAACFCDQRTYENETTTKFTCAKVECPSYFSRLAEPCYYQYDRDSCCEIRKYCPEAKTTVHECSYEGNVYKEGQRFYMGDRLRCVCTPEFDGTASDKWCKKVGCKYELLYIEDVLKRNAPVYYQKVDGCPVDWYNPRYNVGTVESAATGKSSAYGCKYGDLDVPLGQKLTVGQQTDSDTYTTTCSCSTPPLVTCVKTSK